MSKPRIPALIALLIIIAISAGCSGGRSGAAQVFAGVPGNTGGSAGTAEDKTEQETRVGADKAEPRKPEAPEKPAEPQKPETVGPTTVTPPAAPEGPVKKGKKLNFEALNKLDNTKYSWSFAISKETGTPSIPAAAKKLIAAYDGIFTGDTSKKTVYLTFDEGYENGYTASILDTLKANNVKALFFITEPYLKKNRELVKRMLDEGHKVGNHTVSHPSLPGKDNAALEKELLGLDELFRSEFGTGFRYMRPPNGEYSERVLEASKEMGYKTVFWSYAYRDWETDKQKGPDYAYKMVMDNLHSGEVLLLHAVSSDNAGALDRIIKDIKSAGYEIPPFDL